MEYLVDRVVMMRAGGIEEQGDCADVLAHPTRDYTRTLLAAVGSSSFRVEPTTQNCWS